MNIFVAKLAFDTTSEELTELFEQYGTVDSAKVIIDRETGRSKGFGFVEMSDDESGLAAINNLNGAMVDGRAIVVKEARPRGEAIPNRRGGFMRGGGYSGRGRGNDRMGSFGRRSQRGGSDYHKQEQIDSDHQKEEDVLDETTEMSGGANFEHSESSVENESVRGPAKVEVRMVVDMAFEKFSAEDPEKVLRLIQELV
ncbi:MAG: RNA-binding protein, partial [Bacteroidota bacterium]